MTKRQDPEIIVMRAAWKAMRPFDLEARQRMLAWLSARCNQDNAWGPPA